MVEWDKTSAFHSHELMVIPPLVENESFILRQCGGVSQIRHSVSLGDGAGRTLGRDHKDKILPHD